MDPRAAKLALARQKLKDHQEKKLVSVPREDESTEVPHHDASNNILDIREEPMDKNDFKKDDIIDSQLDVMETPGLNNLKAVDADVNVTEMLISNKRHLEMQINELQSRLYQLESNQTLSINNNNILKQQINHLECELKNINEKFAIASKEILSKEIIINQLNTVKSSLSDEISNLQEQLEFTKSILTGKERENISLHNQLSNFQSQLDAAQLQLQQLTNGSQAQLQRETEINSEIWLQKTSSLELQLKTSQKEREQIHSHYESYVAELNEHLKLVVAKNEELTKEIQNLSDREVNLIGQISDMEIRLQNFHQQNSVYDRNEPKTNENEINELQQNYESILEKFQNLSNRYEVLQQKHALSENKLAELSLVKETECNHDNISISKLNADIASDKLAAQRATEQNKKLKTDLQKLEDDFVKISQDKLELTEKLTAEKYLNRELTIKLAEIEENAKDMYTKLMAKDEEMIRLLSSYRDIERKFEKISEDIQESEERNNKKPATQQEHTEMDEAENEFKKEHECEHEYLIEPEDEKNNRRTKIPKEDAMLRLQERFLKIMGEVADLSDEKHRLEHIILQLQNETDTICEYVALYQQQRTLLKKRDEERSAQIKIFQSECELLKNQLEELSIILLRFAEDKELSPYFQVESRHIDLSKVMNLLSNLKNNNLIDPNRKCSELKDFYPCSCCSGKLIDV